MFTLDGTRKHSIGEEINKIDGRGMPLGKSLSLRGELENKYIEMMDAVMLPNGDSNEDAIANLTTDHVMYIMDNGSYEQRLQIAKGYTGVVKNGAETKQRYAFKRVLGLLDRGKKPSEKMLRRAKVPVYSPGHRGDRKLVPLIACTAKDLELGIVYYNMRRKEISSKIHELADLRNFMLDNEDAVEGQTFGALVLG